MRESKPAWYDRPLSATVIGGVIAALLIALATWAVSEGTKGTVPLWAYLVFAALALLVASIGVPPWRRLIWNNVVKGFRWFFAIRPTTRRKREALEQAGYNLRSNEVATERARIGQPIWKIDARDTVGQRNLQFLENTGSAASNVELTTDPELFTLGGDVFWKGPFTPHGPGAFVSKPFNGAPTERGKKEGVLFHVTWQDGNGDVQERNVMLPSEEIRAGRDEGLAEEYARGRTDGRTEAFAEQQATLPLPDPRWSLDYFGEDNGIAKFRIRNLMPDSIVYNARIEVSPTSYFQHKDPAFWKSLSGESSQRFEGRIVGAGRQRGIEIKLLWLDDKHDDRFKTWNVAAPEPVPEIWGAETPF